MSLPAKPRHSVLIKVVAKMSEDNDTFLHFYQKCHFKETCSDPFETCSSKRKCLAQLLSKSQAISSNEATIALLENKFKQYTTLVDNRNGVDNYSKEILALVGNCNSNARKWKFELQDPEKLMNECLKPLTENCQNASADGCTSSEVTIENVNFLLNNRKKAQKYGAAAVASANTVVGELKQNITGPIQNASVFNKNLSKMMLGKDEKMYRCNTNSSQPEWGSRLSQKYPIQQATDKRDNTGSFNSKVNAHCENSFRNKFSANKDPAGFLKNRYSRSQPDPVTVNTSPVDDGRCVQGNSFKTASEELKIQNVKKYGRGCAGGTKTELNTYTYGSNKKSLGGRSRAVTSKFVPPLKSGSQGDQMEIDRNSGSSQGEKEEVDERLRHIDPKMVELICNEIMDIGSPITWNDIAGLHYAKATIQEIVVWPMLRPDIFTGLRRPPKGILLFGPPGTGKTLIGKCIASQSKSTFFSISASSLTSKWIGDGEKMVRALFAVARVHQPAVVFIDEIDSLLSQRSETEHESSRRIKTEFLVQLDGAGTGDEERILVIGATNRPQELDEAARRRLVKRLYIPLPDEQARCQIVENLMMSERNNLTVEQIQEVASLTDGYSGADMKNLCQEASLGPIRSISFNQIEQISPDQVRAVTIDDFKTALAHVRSSVSPKDLETYITWDKTYGSGRVSS